MDKLKFMTRAFALVAILCAIAFAIVGVVSPIEPGMSVFGHVMKCVVAWMGVTVILWVFTYTIGQIIYHSIDDCKQRYGDKWFVEGIKSDWAYIKEQVTWKKFLKGLGFVIAFFAAALLLFKGCDKLWELFSK